MSGYAEAFFDWLACAVGGIEEPATRAMVAATGGDRSPRGRAAVLGTAGHVLDFDDTYLPGIAHLSGAIAPAALALGAARDKTVGDVLDAYTLGWEAMAALSRASYPNLYKRGFHATAACGPVGAAVACAALIGLEERTRKAAIALALLRASGMQAGFGYDAKAIGVGAAAAAGVEATLMAEAGARADLSRASEGFEEVTGGHYRSVGSRPAIERNWIKAYPCCLQTHGAIEAALQAREAGVTDPRTVLIRVHPVSRRAARYDDVQDGLQAKFSLAYLTAYTLAHGAPNVRSFEAADPALRKFARERIRLVTDSQMRESETALILNREWVGWISAAVGSPENPMDAPTLQAKAVGLAGRKIGGILNDRNRPAAKLLRALGLDG